jgi:hypothetical protein
LKFLPNSIAIDLTDKCHRLLYARPHSARAVSNRATPPKLIKLRADSPSTTAKEMNPVPRWCSTT